MARRKSRKSPGNGSVHLVGNCCVSTEEQAREGVSLEAQHERLSPLAIAQGFEMVAIEKNAALSGTLAPASA
jgi:hypothetical protein